MRWQDENFVRLFKRTTPDWSLVPGPARSLFYSILREVDRAGILPMRKGLPAIAHAIGWPQALFDEYFPDLLDDGCVLIEGSNLVIPNFLDAQEVSMSDKLRKEAQRERDQIKALGKESHNSVTSGHAKSRAVTNGHSETRQDKTRQEEDPPKSPKGDQGCLVPDVGPEDSKKPEAATGSRPSREVAHRTAIVLLGELSEARVRVNSRAEPLRPVESNLREIRTRLQENHSADDIRHVIRVCEARAKISAEAAQYFDAVSPFRLRNFGMWRAKTLADAAKETLAGRSGGGRMPQPEEWNGGDVLSRATRIPQKGDDR